MITKKEMFCRLISAILEHISSNRENAIKYLLNEGYTQQQIDKIEQNMLKKIHKKEKELMLKKFSKN
jgi:hypothetical protein